jgi:hypothetical protein
MPKNTTKTVSPAFAIATSALIDEQTFFPGLAEGGLKGT